MKAAPTTPITTPTNELITSSMALKRTMRWKSKIRFSPSGLAP